MTAGRTYKINRMDGDYEPDVRVTPERIVATLLVIAWIIIAFHELGPRRAFGVGFLFLLPLTMVWIPGLMANLASQGRNLDSGATGPVLAHPG